MKTKTCGVHLVPNNNGNLITLRNRMVFCDKQFSMDIAKELSDHKLFHLYITSDEEIKEGDWFIDSSISPRVRDMYYKEFSGGQPTSYKKIIATTDSTLKIIIPRHNDFDSEYDFPQPTKEWLNYYITEYNKGNVISTCEVEYYKIIKTGMVGSSLMFEEKVLIGMENKIFVNQDNTINIIFSKEKTFVDELREYFENTSKEQIIKDWEKTKDFDGDGFCEQEEKIFFRKDVEELLVRCANYFSYPNKTCLKTLDKWIEENLK